MKIVVILAIDRKVIKEYDENPFPDIPQTNDFIRIDGYPRKFVVGAREMSEDGILKLYV